MPLRDGFFSTATQTSCCNRIQRSNRVRLLVVSTHDFPDKGKTKVENMRATNPSHGFLSIVSTSQGSHLKAAWYSGALQSCVRKIEEAVYQRCLLRVQPLLSRLLNIYTLLQQTLLLRLLRFIITASTPEDIKSPSSRNDSSRKLLMAGIPGAIS